jgi:xylulokinase
VRTTIRPDPERAGVYAEFYPRYRELYPSTADIAHFLADRQRAADQ